MDSTKRSLDEFIRIFLDPRTIQEFIDEQATSKQYFIDLSSFSENNFDIIESNQIDGCVRLIIRENNNMIIPVKIDYDEIMDL